MEPLILKRLYPPPPDSWLNRNTFWPASKGTLKYDRIKVNGRKLKRLKNKLFRIFRKEKGIESRIQNNHKLFYRKWRKWNKWIKKNTKNINVILDNYNTKEIYRDL